MGETKAQNCPAENHSSSKGSHSKRTAILAASNTNPAANIALSKLRRGGCHTQCASIMPSVNPAAASSIGALPSDSGSLRSRCRVARRGAGW